MTRSDADLYIRLTMLVLLTATVAAGCLCISIIYVGAQVRSLKPTVTLHEHPTTVKVIQAPAPKLTGLLPEVR